MNEDEWGYVPGTWNIFENSHGWRLTLSAEMLPTRWPGERKKHYAAALLWALNHGMPADGERLEIADRNLV